MQANGDDGRLGVSENVVGMVVSKNGAEKPFQEEESQEGNFVKMF